MRLLVRIIRYSPKQFVGLMACAAVVFCVLPIPLGLATRAFFDAISHRRAGLNVWTVIALVVALQAADVIGQFVLTIPWSGLQQRTHTLIQHNLFTGMLRGFGRHGLTEPPAATISRFRDEPQMITSGSLDAVCDLLGRSLFAVVAAVVMWRINPAATVAAFVPVLLAAAVTDALGTRAAVYGTAARQATARLSGFLGELVAARLAVTVAGAGDRVTGHLRDLGDERRRLAVRDTVFSQVVNSMNFHLVHVATGVVLLISARQIRSGAFSVGDFALFVVFLDQLTYLPAEVGRLITELKQTDKSLDRMHALIPAEARLAVAAPAPLGVQQLPAPGPVVRPGEDALQRLEARGLSYRYPGSDRGIDGVDLTLDRGSFTVVTGRVGSGKTTLLHVLLGLLPGEEGGIRWNGGPVGDPSRFMVPPRVAFTPQVPRLFSETLRDNLLLGRPASDADLAAAIESAVLDRDLAELEAGLDTLVGPRGVKLSGGQVQRAAAARMFLAGADLLVIDDLSSALDAETEASLWSRLFARAATTTCLVVSHRPAALRRADHVILLDGGRVASEGPLPQLLQSSSLMRSLWQEASGPAGDDVERLGE